jgi:L-glyceraldehyde 3-phosphate reductase
LKENSVSDKHVRVAKELNELAAERGQSLAQMALAWVLRDGKVTSALIGASRVSQLEENVVALQHLSFSSDELARIDQIVATHFGSN